MLITGSLHSNWTRALAQVLLRVGIEHDASVVPAPSASLHMRFLITEDPTDDHVSINEAIVSSSIVHHITETQQQQVELTSTDSKVEFTFKDVHIPRRTNITLEFFYTSQLQNGDSGHSIRPEIDKISIIRTISKAGFSAVDEYIDAFRPSNLFKKKVLHYGLLLEQIVKIYLSK